MPTLRLVEDAPGAKPFLHATYRLDFWDKVRIASAILFGWSLTVHIPPGVVTFDKPIPEEE